ncbi:MAG: hypothetical protein JKY52_13230 [Flavobacteriales bacterium]|nr:hypothetical protein [Flavobacteriales bacterium]
MKKLIYLFVGVAFLVSSCTVTQRSTPGAALNVQVNFDMDDLDYIGEVTGTAEQHYFLGLPYGGRKYYAGVIGSGFALDRATNNAIYDALLSKPDADFILPVSVETKTSRVFLGRTKKISIRGKAFKIKSK